MYPLHPLTVHFPIGLLLASSLFTALALRRGGPWETSAYHCLILGCLGGAVAVLSGTLEVARLLTGAEAPRTNQLIGWVNAHAFSSIAALLVYGQALLRRRRTPAILADAAARAGYLRLHLIGALLLIIGGGLGGRLVYHFGLGIAA